MTTTFPVHLKMITWASSMATTNSTLLIDLNMILFRLAVSLYTNMKVEKSSSCSGKSQWPVKVVNNGFYIPQSY